MRNISKQMQEELDKLAAMPDDDINTEDMPEITDWSGTVRGKFYCPPDSKYLFLSEIANGLIVQEKRIKPKQLAGLLNNAGFMTNKHTPYKGSTGLYTLVSFWFNWACNQLGRGKARKMSGCFLKFDGDYIVSN